MMTKINPECQFNAIYKNVEAQINLPSCFKNIFTVIILEYLSTIVDDVKPFSHKGVMRSLGQCTMRCAEYLHSYVLCNAREPR